MAFSDVIQELQDFDVNDLDVENIGSWPMVIKAIVWVAVFLAVLAGGYFYNYSRNWSSLESSIRNTGSRWAFVNRLSGQATALTKF